MAKDHKFSKEPPQQQRFSHEGCDPEMTTSKPVEYYSDRQLEVAKPYDGSIGLGRKNNFVTEATKRDDQKSTDGLSITTISKKL